MCHFAVHMKHCESNILQLKKSKEREREIKENIKTFVHMWSHSAQKHGHAALFGTQRPPCLPHMLNGHCSDNPVIQQLNVLWRSLWKCSLLEHLCFQLLLRNCYLSIEIFLINQHILTLLCVFNMQDALKTIEIKWDISRMSKINNYLWKCASVIFIEAQRQLS